MISGRFRWTRCFAFVSGQRYQRLGNAGKSVLCVTRPGRRLSIILFDGTMPQGL